MKWIEMLIPVALLVEPFMATGALPGNAPTLPVTGARIVNVDTETRLQAAMGDLQNGDTLLLSDGSYTLSDNVAGGLLIDALALVTPGAGAAEKTAAAPHAVVGHR